MHDKYHLSFISINHDLLLSRMIKYYPSVSSYMNNDWLIEQLYFVISDKYNCDNKIWYINIDKIKL